MVDLLRIGLAYLATVFAAVLATVTPAFLMTSALTILDGERDWAGSLWPYFVPALAIGYAITAMSGLPGFLAFVFIAHRSDWVDWKTFALGGALNVVPSLTIFAAFSGSKSPVFQPVILGCCLVGGLVGGIIYRWLRIGRGPTA